MITPRTEKEAGTKLPANPVLSVGSSGSWDSVALSTSSAILDSSGFRIWYSGTDSDNIVRGVHPTLFRVGLAFEPPRPRRVAIDVMPGSSLNPINTKKSGTIPVAVLSDLSFSAPAQVDRSSLTFRRTGDEGSLVRCGLGPKDVNGDSLPDLVCHFDVVKTALVLGDTVGILKGRLFEGRVVVGSDFVQIK